MIQKTILKWWPVECNIQQYYSNCISVNHHYSTIYWYQQFNFIYIMVTNEQMDTMRV